MENKKAKEYLTTMWQKLHHERHAVITEENYTALQTACNLLDTFNDIPRNPTNGDLIKLLFGATEDGIEYDGILWITFPVKNEPSYAVDKWWWNAPYKRG